MGTWQLLVLVILDLMIVLQCVLSCNAPVDPAKGMHVARRYGGGGQLGYPEATVSPTDSLTPITTESLTLAAPELSSNGLGSRHRTWGALDNKLLTSW